MYICTCVRVLTLLLPFCFSHHGAEVWSLVLRALVLWRQSIATFSAVGSLGPLNIRHFARDVTKYACTYRALFRRSTKLIRRSLACRSPSQPVVFFFVPSFARTCSPFAVHAGQDRRGGVLRAAGADRRRGASEARPRRQADALALHVPGKCKCAAWVPTGGALWARPGLYGRTCGIFSIHVRTRVLFLKAFFFLVLAHETTQAKPSMNSGPCRCFFPLEPVRSVTFCYVELRVQQIVV